MKKSKRKLVNLCLALFLALLGGVFFTAGNTKTVQAASRMVMLRGNTTYSSYDFTRDGKKDRFKATADSQSGYMKIYLNGIYKQRIFIGKGADLYWCSISKKDTYLLVMNYLYGGHELKAYMYSCGKFKSTPGESNLNKVLPFSRFKKVSGNTLYVESETAGYWRNPASLKNLPSITVETKFTVKNNKITCASWNSKVTGSRTFYAQNSFRTSKSMTKLSVKDGPYVRAGQKVTLNYIRLNRSTFLYQISVNGRTGWFADSQSIKFR